MKVIAPPLADSAPRFPWWAALLFAVAALGVLYAGAIRTGFLNDDHLFLEVARTRPLAESIGELGPLGNFYRPLSRQVYFEALSRLAGGEPIVFHGVNYVLFLVSLVLLGDLLSAFLGPRGVMAGLLYFALLPMQRVNLVWISCSQDVLALVGSLAAIALYRRGRMVPAALAYAAAIASKESALPLPAVLAAWDAVTLGKRPKRILARLWPFLALGTAWAALGMGMRARHGATGSLTFTPEAFTAGYAHMVQSLLGLDHVSGFVDALTSSAPPVLPFFLLAPLSLWFMRTSPAAPEPRLPARKLSRFALVWLIALGSVAGPVVSSWSAYYYTLAAAGAAILVGFVLGRGDRWVWLALTTGMLWWHAGGTSIRAFAITERPWVWTSHLTSFQLERGATLADSMKKQLVRLEPHPPKETRFFFATLPSWAGFQMGNGALIRNLYRDPSLQSYFYSQFSESTAADRPCRILYWDGERLGPLYPGAREPMFQVGSDLLLLDKPSGAAHAFRRGLAEGESAMDNLYWLGWAELWNDHRDMAEAVWTRFGAVDDSLRWIAHLRAARRALFDDADTVSAKRHLVKAIEYGIGRPEAHAVLGQLLVADQPKYGMLQLKAAAWLKPDDWQVRRDFVVALERAHYDDAARDELNALQQIYPEWRADSVLTRVDRVLGSGGRQGMAPL